MISGEHITKQFGELKALDEVSLKVEAGEMLSITGVSGAGKTTLLQVLGTLMRPDRGRIICQGEDISQLGEKALSRFRNRQIGFVFQFHHLLPEFTALENVCIPAYINQASRKEAEEKARELLDFLKMGGRLEHKPTQMSGGEQQRVAIARALINRPAVILADEPTGNLDSANTDELYQLFRSLQKEFNQTFVIVTHNREMAAKTDRVLEMKDGRIIN